MNLALVLIIGAAIGAMEGVSIFFEPAEPYKVEIFLAATLKNMRVPRVLVSHLRLLTLAGSLMLDSGFAKLLIPDNLEIP